MQSMTTNNFNTLLIHSDGQGISRKSGIDTYGCTWVEVEVDAFAEQTDLICSECETVTDTGWLCLDGGQERCNSCIDFIH